MPKYSNLSSFSCFHLLKKPFLRLYNSAFLSFYLFDIPLIFICMRQQIQQHAVKTESLFSLFFIDLPFSSFSMFAGGLLLTLLADLATGGILDDITLKRDMFRLWKSITFYLLSFESILMLLLKNSFFIFVSYAFE